MADRLKTLVEHAHRVWLAEEENARRLNTKRNHALTQVGVIIGVLVIKAGRLDVISVTPFSALALLRAALGILLAGMLVLAARALLASSTPQAPRGMHASEYMFMTPQELKTSKCPDHTVALQTILYKLTDAGMRLSTINRTAAYNIGRGQMLLSNAYLFALALLLLLGLFPSGPSKAL